MFNFFPFRMPYFNFPYYNNPYNKKYYQNSTPFAKNVDNYCDETKNSTTISSSTITNSSNHDEQAFISIFGINLYSDDILILCILFFLYSEGIKDEMLFICLILLLLS